MKQRERRAFTLIEVLFVIGIIGVLLALLLPAVQHAREAARRATCQNNLMQLGLALQLHHQAYGSLPAGVQNDAGPIRHEPKGKHYSWVTQILPYIEQSNAQTQIDFTRGVYDRAHVTLRRLEMNVLACPSHRYGGWGCDYAGCHHDVEAPIDADNHGVLFLNSALRFDQISDGRSQTLLVGEKLTEQDAEQGMPSEFDAMGMAPEGLTPDEIADIAAAAPPMDEPAADPFAWMNPVKPTNFGWMSGTRATLRNTGTAINQRRLAEASGIAEPPADEAAAAAAAAAHLLHVGGFESNHLGGAQFVFADGAVRFINQQISTAVYQQLGHRADGKLLNAAAF